ncbi:MYXO-CTERM sorting domain-containing protein [Streptomyces anulatus]|uniref:MYXO-CTERM sorting domain-containing protein n=1 Tax=Streptomyces anulatus TaxID=1892 RepID=UPI0034436C38
MDDGPGKGQVVGVAGPLEGIPHHVQLRDGGTQRCHRVQRQCHVHHDGGRPWAVAAVAFLGQGARRRRRSAHALR